MHWICHWFFTHLYLCTHAVAAPKDPVRVILLLHLQQPLVVVGPVPILPSIHHVCTLTEIAVVSHVVVWLAFRCRWNTKHNIYANWMNNTHATTSHRCHLSVTSTLDVIDMYWASMYECKLTKQPAPHARIDANIGVLWRANISCDVLRAPSLQWREITIWRGFGSQLLTAFP